MSLASVFLTLVLILLLADQIMSGIIVPKEQVSLPPPVTPLPDTPNLVLEPSPTVPFVSPPGKNEMALQVEEGQQQEKTAELAAPREESEAKQTAWQRWYKRTPGCEAAGADIVACANQYIVAKREFERTYAAGMIR